MPELPEVETIRRGLAEVVLHRKIKKIIIKKPNLVKQSRRFFCRGLIGMEFTKIDRVGKLLIFHLKSSEDCSRENGDKNLKNNTSQTLRQGVFGKKYLLVHLKMTGQLVFCDEKNFVAGGHANSKKEEEQFFEGKVEKFCQPGKYTHIIFEFESLGRGKVSILSSSKLFFNDLRQFGSLKVVNVEELNKIKKKYGIEPGRVDFTLSNFCKVLENRKGKIKAVLLNQAIISGLGNIYVDESLFASQIHPERSVDSLTKREQKSLFNNIQKIIKLALKYNGTTFSDFVDSKGKKGDFKQMLKVYGRVGKPCLRCQRKKNNKVLSRCLPKIKKIKVAGRGTSFCEACQK